MSRRSCAAPACNRTALAGIFCVKHWKALPAAIRRDLAGIQHKPSAQSVERAVSALGAER